MRSLVISKEIGARFVVPILTQAGKPGEIPRDEHLRRKSFAQLHGLGEA